MAEFKDWATESITQENQARNLLTQIMDNAPRASTETVAQMAQVFAILALTNAVREQTEMLKAQSNRWMDRWLGMER